MFNVKQRFHELPFVEKLQIGHSFTQANVLHRHFQLV